MLFVVKERKPSRATPVAKKPSQGKGIPPMGLRREIGRKKNKEGRLGRAHKTVGARSGGG